ncbi:MAG: InlB B-repeat-containing protein [Anaerotignum sp.]|nr:InlB B-repeat-containing protein [Anaerotignum sp.]
MKHRKNRILCVIFAVIMIFGLLPVGQYVYGAEDSADAQPYNGEKDGSIQVVDFQYLNRGNFENSTEYGNYFTYGKYTSPTSDEERDNFSVGYDSEVKNCTCIYPFLKVPEEGVRFRASLPNNVTVIIIEMDEKGFYKRSKYVTSNGGRYFSAPDASYLAVYFRSVDQTVTFENYCNWVKAGEIELYPVDGEPYKLTEISVTNPPKKIEYTAGESFKTEDMVVTAKYSDETTKTIIGYTYYPDGKLTTEDNKITISYTESGVTKETTQSIKVNSASSGGDSRGGGSRGSSVTTYSLTYESNGGSSITATKHDKNATVNLTAIPAREGYDFTGWYADKELKNAVTFVKMDGNKTVYAGWKEAVPAEETPLLVVTINSMKYQLNGKTMTMDSAPFIDGNNRTMLPVRVIANALGISNENIKWDSATKTASFTRADGKVVSCTVNSNVIQIGDEKVTIDTVPVIRNGRIYLPMRALFNAFDVPDENILWDAAARTVTVTKKD